jgi:lycopene beta-cyclase
MAKRLARGVNPVKSDSFRQKMFYWYDMTLLDVLLKKKVEGEKLFSSLFGKNNPERILAFLTDESNHLEEFKIRNSVPQWPFITSGIHQLFRYNP